MVEGAALGVEAAVVCGAGGGGELEDLPAHPWSLATVVVVVVVVESHVVVSVAAASLFSLAEATAWPSSELTAAEGVTGMEDVGMDDGKEDEVVDGGGEVGGEEVEEEEGQGGAGCDRSEDEGETDEDGDEDEDGEDEEDGEDDIVEDGADDDAAAVEDREKDDVEEDEEAAGESCEGSGVAS